MPQEPTHTVTPTRTEAAAAWVGRHGGHFRLVLLVTLCVALLAGSFVAYPLTEDGSYSRELVAAAIGALATVVTAVGVGLLSLWKQLRDRRQASRLRRFDESTWRTSALQVGRMKVPDIVVVASCDRRQAWTDKVQLELVDAADPRHLAPEVAHLRTSRLPAIQEHAKATGVTLRDDPCVDLVHAAVSLETGPDGRRRQCYTLTASVGSYFDFAVSSADLDAAWMPSSGVGSGTSLRNHWGSFPTTIGDVSSLPTLAKVGVGTAVVTSDGRLVLGVRGRTFIAGNRPARSGRSRVHIAAEGMLPTDRNHRGQLDPRVTARRALEEELNLGSTRHSHGHVEDLVATGFFFDQLRWQPCFAYLARINLSWDELQTIAPAAADYWEVERLHSLPYDIESAGLRHLLTGTHPDLELASNHAAAVVWFALLHQHGFFDMRDALTAPGAVWVPRSDEGQGHEPRPRHAPVLDPAHPVSGSSG